MKLCSSLRLTLILGGDSRFHLHKERVFVSFRQVSFPSVSFHAFSFHVYTFNCKNKQVTALEKFAKIQRAKWLDSVFNNNTLICRFVDFY